MIRIDIQLGGYDLDGGFRQYAERRLQIALNASSHEVQR